MGNPCAIPCVLSKIQNPNRQIRIGETNIELVPFFRSVTPFSRYSIFSVISALKRTDVLKYGHNSKYLVNYLTDRKNGTSPIFVSSMRFFQYATWLYLDDFEKWHYIVKNEILNWNSQKNFQFWRKKIESYFFTHFFAPNCILSKRNSNINTG